MRAVAIVGEVREIVAGHIDDLQLRPRNRGIIGNQPAEEKQLVVVVRGEQQDIRALERLPGLHKAGQIALGKGEDVADDGLAAPGQTDLNALCRRVQPDIFVQITVLPAALLAAVRAQRPIAGIAAEADIERDDLLLGRERQHRARGEGIVCLIDLVEEIARGEGVRCVERQLQLLRGVLRLRRRHGCRHGCRLGRGFGRGRARRRARLLRGRLRRGEGAGGIQRRGGQQKQAEHGDEDDELTFHKTIDGRALPAFP